MSLDSLPLATAYGASAASAPLAGRVVVRDGRFANDGGFVGIRGISEFSTAHLTRIGRESEVVRRYVRAAGAGRNVARVLAMANIMFDLRPSHPGYWDALDRVVTLGDAHGLYTELCAFADAQIVMPSHADRAAFVRDFAAFCRERTAVIPQLANEPSANGFESATDPKLLELSDIFAASFGSLGFSIGDPPDVVNVEGGDPLATELKWLALHSDILVLHGDRSEDGARFARWVDHLKGFDDFRGGVRKGVAFWHDEPMGMASVRDVPLPSGRTYRRENRADALVAAACICAITQTGFTTHYISEQDDTIPGLVESAIASQIPQTPEWRFVNAGIGGSSVIGFDGFEKVRPCSNGREAWACGYGLRKGSIAWASGYVAEKVYDGPNVEVWKARR